MAYGFSAVLPLQKSEEDGFYALTKNLAENTKQNFKNLLLTTPGERVMIPNFGVGLRRYLFEIPARSADHVKAEIHSKIIEQLRLYMPFVKLVNIEFFEEDPRFTGHANALAMKIFYSISRIGASDSITVSNAKVI